MHELVLRAPATRVEGVADALMDRLGALSVSVEDADAGSDAERALFGEPGLPAPREGWHCSELTALFETEAAATAAATWLHAQDGATELSAWAMRAVAEQDWVRLTQSQFAPVPITPSFWIVPSWHEAPAQARQVIRLDPGLAFGTGTHPTTRMCLRWIAAHTHTLARPGVRVLDYGCGSGILAIAAALHGAGDVTAVDIDPAAVQSARANSAANATAATGGGPAPALQIGLPDIASGRYALVLANILASPLKLLAPLLTAHLEHGGDLVLAGILERQCDELLAAYAPFMALKVSDSEDGWILMTGRRSGAPAMA